MPWFKFFLTVTFINALNSNQYMAYKVEVTDECIKCGLCVSVCDNFELKEDKAYPKKADIEENDDSHKEAVEGCPVTCIHINEVKNGT